MGLFGSVSSKQVDEFARSLVHKLAKQYPPEHERDGVRKLSPKRFTAILDETFNKAAEFKKQHKLGVYKKARLGNTFRWELQDLGYSDNFVKTITEVLIVHIAKKD